MKSLVETIADVVEERVKNVEVYDASKSREGGDPWVFIPINLPVKKDGNRAATTMNGRKVVIIYWATPTKKWTVGQFKNETDATSSSVYTAKNEEDAAGWAAEFLFDGRFD